jgi:hypothetical protein
MPSSSLLKSSLAIARAAFTPLAVAFLGIAAFGSRDAVAAILAQTSWVPLAFAASAWALLNLLVPAISRSWLAGLASSPTYRTLLDIHLRRLPARYLPGGIWHTVSRVADLHALGVGRAQLGALILLENLAPLAVALVLGGLFALASGQRHTVVWALLMAGTTLIFLLPLLLRSFFPEARRPPASANAAAYALILAFWSVAGSAFVVYWVAFPTPLPDGGMAGVMAAYLLSWAAGFVAVFAPQGVGVFESVASWLLKGELPFAGIAVLVAGFRATMLAGDTVAYLLALAWRRRAGLGGRRAH